MITELNSLLWHVMDAMADDWESAETIRPHVTRFHGATNDQDIVCALRELHNKGFVQMMDEHGRQNTVFRDQVGDLWFSMTDAGRAIWDSEGEKFRDD